MKLKLEYVTSIDYTRLVNGSTYVIRCSGPHYNQFIDRLLVFSYYNGKPDWWSHELDNYLSESEPYWKDNIVAICYEPLEIL